MTSVIAAFEKNSFCLHIRLNERPDNVILRDCQNNKEELRIDCGRNSFWDCTVKIFKCLRE